MAYLLVKRSAWSLMGGMEASTSSACVVVVLNAAHTSIRALRCSFSKGLAMHLVPFHQVGHA